MRAQRTLVVEWLLRPDRALTLGALALLCALAWLYLLSGAGLTRGMPMTSLALFPHRQVTLSDAGKEQPGASAPMAGMAMPGMDMPGMDMPGTRTPRVDAAGIAPGASARAGLAADPGHPLWSGSAWLLMIVMWWIMMIAMMTPSASAAILLYAQVHRHAVTHNPAQVRIVPTWAFAAGYFAGWLAFAVVAAAAQWLLQHAALLSAAMMDSRSRWLSGGLLAAAGLYQLSPLKARCLSHCRSPASFLARHWRARIAGALRLGLLHSGYCLGCCWVLMTLLFVGGVMNMAWIVALALLVLLEKRVRGGMWVARGAGALLILWSLATLLH